MSLISSDTFQTIQPMAEQAKSKKSSMLLLAGIIVICITGFFSFYIGKMTVKPSIVKQQTNITITPSLIKNNNEENNTSISPLNNKCNKDGCLFEDKTNDAVIGFATLEGYYETYDKKDWGDINVTCDAIVVTNGNTTLIDSLLKWVKQGNAINRTNEKGQLILNIDLGSINETYQKQIKTSNVSNPVKLDVVRILPRGMGAPGCTSLIDIITVKS